ncbi:MAG: hypothetical protein PHC83_03480 [Bacteroidales bacterium]|nr:hypothetical protein [Bacteroidales bacterium]MDD4209937.1 hypothetical protein [Bacteroidales bacterium]
MLKKSFCLFLILFIIHLNSCQNINKLFSFLDFKVVKVNEEEQYFINFNDSHTLSMWGDHKCYNKINDSLFFVALNSGSDTLFVYNYETHQVKTIELKKTPHYSIDHIYYHNHDSIFIFYRRVFIFNKTDNQFDFILINKEGEVVNTYSLNQLPYIYKGNVDYMIEYAIQDIRENRIIDGNLLIPLGIYSPPIHDSNFVKFNPKLLCSYNLANKTLKMLNVKFPTQDIGKKFHPDTYFSFIKICFDKNQDIIVFFPYSNYLYQYDFDLDSLLLIKCIYDNTFQNIDIASRKNNENYMDIRFFKPEWYSSENYYIRRLSIWNYKSYVPTLILEVMDSNFNHIAYMFDNKNYKTPYYFNNKLSSLNKHNNLSYLVLPEKTPKKISWQKYEKSHLMKMVVKKKHKISINKYLKKKHIPKNSLVIIINLNYPCGSCLKFLMSEMKNNLKDFQKNQIYYILYDNNPTSNFAESLIKNYSLSKDNIIIDKKLLQNVYEEYELDEHYRLIEYGDTIFVEKCTFEELVPLFERKVNEKLMK